MPINKTVLFTSLSMLTSLSFGQSQQAARNVLLSESLIVTPITPKKVKMLDHSQSKILTEIGAEQETGYAESYFPDSEKLDILSITIQTASGKTISLPKSAVITKLSAASQEAPGFTNSVTASVQYPKLSPGEIGRAHV